MTNKEEKMLIGGKAKTELAEGIQDVQSGQKKMEGNMISGSRYIKVCHWEDGSELTTVPRSDITASGGNYLDFIPWTSSFVSL